MMKGISENICQDEIQPRLQQVIVCFMLPWLLPNLLFIAIWIDSFLNEPGSINWKYIEQIVQGVLFQRKNNSSVNIL